MRQLGMFDQATGDTAEMREEAVAVAAVEAESVKRDKLIRKEAKKANKKANAEQLMQLIKRQSFRCALSGVEISPETARLDHIMPVSQGGTDEIVNLQWLHVDANTAKGTMSQEQFILMCRRVSGYRG
jgi:hypothetical protein